MDETEQKLGQQIWKTFPWYIMTYRIPRFQNFSFCVIRHQVLVFNYEWLFFVSPLEIQHTTSYDL